MESWVCTAAFTSFMASAPQLYFLTMSRALHLYANINATLHTYVEHLYREDEAQWLIKKRNKTPDCERFTKKTTFGLGLNNISLTVQEHMITSILLWSFP